MRILISIIFLILSSNLKSNSQRLRLLNPSFESPISGIFPNNHAQLLQVFSELVVENEEGYLGVKYTALISVLIKAVQVQQLEIEELKARLE